MGMVIDNDEFERLAHQLADRRGTSVDEALTDLVRRELEREGVVPAGDDGARRARTKLKRLEERESLLPPEQREERKRRAEEFMTVVREVQRNVAALPDLDPRPIEEIMRDMYDEDGLPR